MGDEVTDPCAVLDEIVACVIAAAKSDYRFGQRHAGDDNSPQPPQGVDTHDAHIRRIFLFCHRSDHKGIKTVGIFRNNVYDLHPLISHVHAFGKGYDNPFGPTDALQQRQS